MVKIRVDVMVIFRGYVAVFVAVVNDAVTDVVVAADAVVVVVVVAAVVVVVDKE